MTQGQLVNWLEGRGWKRDDFGNFRLTVTVKEKTSTFRIKFQTSGIRYERKEIGGWKRMITQDYEKLSVTSEGKLKGLLQ